VDGVFACGNVVHVHDLVDDVTLSAITAGREAAKYVKNGKVKRKKIRVRAGENVRYVVPQIINGRNVEEVRFYFRVKREMKNVVVKIIVDENVVKEKREMVVRPPEMVKIATDANLLKKAGNITIEVVEVA